MHPWKIVNEFEQAVAKYAGAPYGVAVDSCTNALFLSLVLLKRKYGEMAIEIPCRTYVGVAHAIINAGHKCFFDSYDWTGVYPLFDTPIIDAARRFTSRMYAYPYMLYCLSFHWHKHLPIGRGGMILLDNIDDYALLRRMRYDGRTEMVRPKYDTFDVPGYHCMMHPDDAARGLMLMQGMPRHNADLPMDDYADLSKHSYFTRNRNDGN